MRTNRICHAAHLGALHIRQEELRRCVVAQARIARVGADAHYLNPIRLCRIANFQFFPDRVPIGKPLARQALINHGHFCGRRSILRAKAAPRNDRNAHRRKEPIPHHVDHFARRIGLAGDLLFRPERILHRRAGEVLH